MKAIHRYGYGTWDAIQIVDTDKPTPNADDVLIKVHASSINVADWYMLQGKPRLIRADEGFRTPKNPKLGGDVAGIVEAVGTNVTRFTVGDAVMGDISSAGRGGMAEFAIAPERLLVKKPANLSFEQAAAVPLAGVTALQGIQRIGGITKGESVLINGASGGVGTYTLQLAKHYGAKVTAVCSTRNIELVQSLGADYVIDYTKTNFTQQPERYDLILAVNGYHPIWAYRRALKADGRYTCLGGTMPQVFQAMLLGGLVSLGTSKTLTSMGIANPNYGDLGQLVDRVDAGHVTPIIDECYPLEQAATAFRHYSEQGARGKIVITMTA